VILVNGLGNFLLLFINFIIVVVVFQYVVTM